MLFLPYGFGTTGGLTFQPLHWKGILFLPQSWKWKVGHSNVQFPCILVVTFSTEPMTMGEKGMP